MKYCDLGIIGMGVMGRNLAENFAGHGYRVACHDQRPETLDRIGAGTGQAKPITTTTDPRSFVAALRRPRILLAMVPTGPPVETVLDTFLPHLDAGDIIIDGGNSHFRDTCMRESQCARQGVDFIGLGVSGGSDGARKGPCLMAGGPAKAWAKVGPMLERISARDRSGQPCCARVGPDGSGHFVKMAHNGIEYAELQLIAEAHLFMRYLLGMPHDVAAEAFSNWSGTEAGSFLVDAAVKVLRRHNPEGKPVIDCIADRSQQKGTGRWTVKSAWSLGVPMPVVSASVNARYLSNQKDLHSIKTRRCAALRQTTLSPDGLLDAFIAAKIIAFSEGFSLLEEASKAFAWNLDLQRISALWQGGCILQSNLLELAHAVFSHADETSKGLPFALREPVRKRLAELAPGWREVLHEATDENMPVPAHSAALSTYDAWRFPESGARLVQGMRDFFGGHGFERIDRPGGEIHREPWRAHEVIIS
ncbi:MAG: NADP-dependent phosphogluconate dehydrogenase [Opitutales bacterium]|nr:NADP-dependent phosphogluconate dehydrogenase [Opitutales bacterium]